MTGDEESTMSEDSRDHRYTITEPKAPAWEARLVCACGWYVEAKYAVSTARGQYRQHILEVAFDALGLAVGPMPDR